MLSTEILCILVLVIVVEKLTPFPLVATQLPGFKTSGLIPPLNEMAESREVSLFPVILFHYIKKLERQIIIFFIILNVSVKI